MSDWLLDDLDNTEGRSLVQRYLEHPFSIPLAKLDALLQATQSDDRAETAPIADK